MKNYSEIYINGHWSPSESKESRDVICPSTEQVIGRVPNATQADAMRAVTAARNAFSAWSATPVSQRVDFATKIHEGLAARADEIAKMISTEMGSPLPLSEMMQAALPVFVSQNAAEIAESLSYEKQEGSALVLREPIGVVACITPWNYPLHQIVAKVLPAIAAGCTVVLKPAEDAPLNAFLLAEVIDDAGVPAGVFNLINGDGPVVGQPLAAHPDVDMLSFTGSTAVGRHLSKVAADTVKRVSLELGGKSASVILDDADLEAAIPASVQACMLNSGQSCIAQARMLVPEDKYDEVVKLAVAAMANFPLVDPLSGEMGLGPLITEKQRGDVLKRISKAISEGAEVLVGGEGTPEGFEEGYYVKPTLFGGVTRDMSIAREETFGPVLSIMTYRDEEEAIAIANDSIYGLSGAVWSGDVERAKRVAGRMRTGQVVVNGADLCLTAPFGGYKQSGNGRELGVYGFEEFLEYKALHL